MPNEQIHMSYSLYRLMTAEAMLQSAKKALRDIGSRAGAWQIEQALQEIHDEWGVFVNEDER